MSKSAADPKGLVNIMDDNNTILKKIKSAVTDTDGIIKFDREAKPGVSNLLGIHSAISGRSVEILEAEFEGAGYGVLKAEVADVVIAAIEPIRERTQELMSDQTELDRLLADGAEKANEQAEATLAKVYEAIGFLKAKH
jgi:tryptophanyl-tRNA synthetase